MKELFLVHEASPYGHASRVEEASSPVIVRSKWGGKSPRGAVFSGADSETVLARLKIKCAAEHLVGRIHNAFPFANFSLNR
jgi:hypothetical protein